MRKQSGYSLLEAMIISAIIVIMIFMFLGYGEGMREGSVRLGFAEIRCTEGSKWVVPDNDYAHPFQMVDTNGKPVPCER